MRGVVQGVGFRPFVFRLARANSLAGWVLNEEDGVEIHVEGCEAGFRAFLSRADRRSLRPPRTLQRIDIQDVRAVGTELSSPFARAAATGHLRSASRPICLSAKRACRSCSIRPIRAICIHISTAPIAARATPSSRACRMTARTRPCGTGRLDAFCASQYRRSARSPVSCSTGRLPRLRPALLARRSERCNSAAIQPSIKAAAELLSAGRIVAIKGIGGYHLSLRCPESRRSARSA